MSSALIGDFNGDGRPDILLPDQSGRRLLNVQRTGSGSRENFSLPLGGRMATNLGAVVHPDGGITLCLGLEDGNPAFIRF